ncbi:Phage terminase large subunit (GpA) [Polystyrenella longa]|uniref:Phage terminase large subunit (GpA) n=2 Tax=Polystyrenella longa TaxID=2528007 RepID=A0A518CTW1_9PLAN|nr:Phage terminase large subunit (GpA) [Polystyrenella longa]
MGQFAEEEIVIPDGPYAGRRFSCNRQPFSRLWFDAVDSGKWRRLAATGPQQSGKTLDCFIIPILWHLFEFKETVLCGVTSMAMAKEKWEIDILPVIRRSRYRDLLPRSGKGSRGGQVDMIQFEHGPVLKFVTGGGDDKSRSHFTSRVLVVTEVDGLDESGATSREASKLKQMEGRTSAYDDRARIYLECTVSTAEGAIWQEYQRGTQSRIVMPCPHCHAWVTPERDDLVGWHEAEHEHAAKQSTQFSCPECGECWTEEERAQANQECRLLHRGQSLNEEGEIEGELPPTDTLGFRWNAANNLFVSAGTVGAREWRGSNQLNADEADKELCQWVWAIPPKPLSEILNPIEESVLRGKVISLQKLFTPPETTMVTVGLDIGKYFLHYVAMALTSGGRFHIVDYNEIKVRHEGKLYKDALPEALNHFKTETVDLGWVNADGQPIYADRIWIDSGYWESTDLVYQFCRDQGARWQPMKGYGFAQETKQQYNQPKSTGATVSYIGTNYHRSWLSKKRTHLMEVNSDFWKSRFWQHILTDPRNPGSLTICDGTVQDHRYLFKHLMAEEERVEFIPGKGEKKVWIQRGRNNHYLDAGYIATVAMDYNEHCRQVQIAAPPPQTTSPLLNPYGQAFSILDR